MSNRRAEISVLVTGVGGGSYGEQILKALRLARIPLRIFGGDVNRDSAGLQAVDRPYLLPPAKDPAYIDSVLELCRREGIRALFPGSDAELKAVSARRAGFAKQEVLVPINPEQVIDLCMDKLRTCEFLSARGFKVPSFRRIRSVGEAAAFDCLPAILKPSVGGGGSANVFLAQSKDEICSMAAQLLAVHDEFLIQAYVGTPASEYTVGVLSDMDGALIDSIGVRRQILSALSNRIKLPNRSGDAKLGPLLAVSSGVSQGEIGPFREVAEPCERMAAAIGARGPLNVQCRLVDGEVYVMEINPRFSGTTSLRAMVGFNEPEILIRKHILKEQPRGPLPCRSGTIVRGLSETLISREKVPSAKDLLAPSPLASPATGRRVLLTGGTGLIGSAILERLAGAGYYVHCLGRTPPSKQMENVSWIEADISGDPGRILERLPQADAVVHAGAAVRPSSEPDALSILLASNMAFTEALFRWAASRRVGPVIYISGLNFLRKPLAPLIDESHPLAPLTPYGLSKYWGEIALLEHARDGAYRPVSLRVSSPLPGSRTLLHATVVKRWIELALQKLPLVVHGSGARTQDFVDTADVADAVAAALETESASGVYQIASGQAVSMSELSEQIACRTGSSVVHEGEDANEAERWNLSIEKARKDLSYAPRRSLDATIETLLKQ